MVSLFQSNTDQDFLRRTVEETGLEFLGVAKVSEDPTAHAEAQENYNQWLSEGKHGTMAYLERHSPAKYNPDLALPGTKSMVVVGLGYLQPRPVPGPARGLVAQYAWGRDYHKVLLEKLKKSAGALALRWPGDQWRTFTDTAPLDERYWAARAGASFTARNTLAVNRALGSWFLLGEILTTVALDPTPVVSHGHGTCPSACRRCRDICPTGALGSDGRIDARKCISYLTIEHRGPIADELKAGLGPRIFGCDLCQEICPLNLAVSPTIEPEFLGWKAGPDLDLAEVLVLDKEKFTARFGGSPVHRAGRDGLVRNACLVAANTGRTELLGLVVPLAHDQDAGVADAARWALGRLNQGGLV